MEHVNADMCIGEAASGEGEKAAVHVTAEELDAAALIGGILQKIGKQISEINAWEDINDAAEGTVGEITVEAGDVPAFRFRIIDPGGTLKLIDAEGLGEKTRFREINGTEDRENLRLGETVVDGDVTERASSHESGADIEPCGHREL